MLDFSVGKPWKLLLQFSIPLLISNLLTQFYYVVDLYIVGNFIGANATAAVMTTMSIMFALVSLAIGITMGSSVIISQYFGAKDSLQIKRSIDTIIIFIFLASLTISFAGIVFCDALLRVIGTPEDVFADARTYALINFAGLLPLFGINCLIAILRGVGDSKTPLYALLISSGINIVLSLTFVLGLGLGIAGAAYSTVLAQSLTVAGMVFWLNRKHTIIKITLRKLEFAPEIFRNKIRIGLPNGIQHALAAVGMMAVLGIVNNFTAENSDILIAYSIVNRIDALAMSPAMAISIAIGAFTGQNIGAQKIFRIPYGLKAALLMSTLLTVVISAILMIFATPIMKMFSSEISAETIFLGRRYLLIVCPFIVVFSTMFIVSGVMRGAGDTLVPMFISLLALWIVRIPIASFLSEKIGADGIWVSIPVAWCVGCACAVLYYRTGRWKKKGVIKPIEDY